MKGNADMKLMKEARDKANLALVTARQRIKDLEAKKDVLGKGDGLGVEMKTAEAKKRGILARFVLGDTSKEELNSAKNAFERAKRSEEESKEIIAAIDDVIDEIRRELPALEQGFQAAEKALWRCVAEALKEEAVILAGDLIAKAYAADSGGPFEQWLEGVFKTAGQAAFGNSSALRQQIEQEYLGK